MALISDCEEVLALRRWGARSLQRLHLRRCTQVLACDDLEGLCVCVAALKLLPCPALSCPAWWNEAPLSRNMGMQRVMESLPGGAGNISVKHAESGASPLPLLCTPVSAVKPLHERRLLQSTRCPTGPRLSCCSSFAGLQHTSWLQAVQGEVATNFTDFLAMLLPKEAAPEQLASHGGELTHSGHLIWDACLPGTALYPAVCS